MYYLTNILNVLVHCDIEEAKTQENKKLQHALQEMERQFQEIEEAKKQEKKLMEV